MRSNVSDLDLQTTCIYLAKAIGDRIVKLGDYKFDSDTDERCRVLRLLLEALVKDLNEIMGVPDGTQ